MRKNERWACPDGEWVVEMIDKNGDYDGYRPRRVWDGHPEYIRMYTEGPCPQIQAHLRAGKSDYDRSKNFGLSLKKVIRGLDKELDKRAANPGCTLYRMDDGYLASTRKGDVVVDKGYLSTTTDKSIFSGKRSYLYIIDCFEPGGAKVDDLSHYNEKEYLFKRNSKFTVVYEGWTVMLNKSVRLIHLRYEGEA